MAEKGGTGNTSNWKENMYLKRLGIVGAILILIFSQIFLAIFIFLFKDSFYLDIIIIFEIFMVSLAILFLFGSRILGKLVHPLRFEINENGLSLDYYNKELNNISWNDIYKIQKDKLLRSIFVFKKSTPNIALALGFDKLEFEYSLQTIEKFQKIHKFDLK